jgi:hypothetical protein
MVPVVPFHLISFDCFSKTITPALAPLPLSRPRGLFLLVALHFHQQEFSRSSPSSHA